MSTDGRARSKSFKHGNPVSKYTKILLSGYAGQEDLAYDFCRGAMHSIRKH